MSDELRYLFILPDLSVDFIEGGNSIRPMLFVIVSVPRQSVVRAESREVVGSELVLHWQLRVDNIRLMVPRS